MTTAEKPAQRAERFITHLGRLKDHNPGALAALRHSLAFEPGTWPRAFPFVEMFASSTAHGRDPDRLALYAVAGLFARHPEVRKQSFASAFGELAKQPGSSASLEGRFIALLEADADNIVDYLRPAVTLLAAKGIGFDYAGLLLDLGGWLNPMRDPVWLRQRWARDFYRELQPAADSLQDD